VACVDDQDHEPVIIDRIQDPVVTYDPDPQDSVIPVSILAPAGLGSSPSVPHPAPNRAGRIAVMDEGRQRSAEDFLTTVLSDAADDLSGVYEVWWQANAWYPGWPLSRRLQLAEDTVTGLVRDGLARLYRGEWETAGDHPVPSDETEALLRKWETWTIPEGPFVFLYATEKGAAMLRDLATIRPTAADATSGTASQER
jgi:hypothetical protein